MASAPFQIVSLREVLYYCAPLFYRATVDLHELRHRVAALVKKFGHESFIDEHKHIREPLSRLLNDLLRECNRIELREPLARLEHSRVQTIFNSDAHSMMRLGELQHELNELHDAIDADLFMRRFYVLKEGEADLFYDDRLRPLPELFGAQVSAAFPSALEDIKEVGNCFATGRDTACVFHCMRVLEHGLRAMAKRLKVKLPKNLSVDLAEWRALIDNIEKEISNIENAKRTPKRQKALEFYHGAASQFRHFKNAWRNHVMHTSASYDHEEAERVMRHVREFMQHLAANGVKEAKKRRKTS